MIFVSHKETDSALAKALVEFLRASLELPPAKIRCTSVPGFQLPFGKTISGQLKDDIGTSNAVFVLITQASLQSRWVLFELGAAWALGKVIIPILGPGLSQSDLPGPLMEYPVVRSDDSNAAARLRDAVAQIAKELKLTENSGGEPQSGLESFMKLLREWAPMVPLGGEVTTPLNYRPFDHDRYRSQIYHVLGTSERRGDVKVQLMNRGFSQVEISRIWTRIIPDDLLPFTRKWDLSMWVDYLEHCVRGTPFDDPRWVDTPKATQSVLNLKADEPVPSVEDVKI